jgi:hypothetical protein
MKQENTLIIITPMNIMKIIPPKGRNVPEWLSANQI